MSRESRLIRQVSPKVIPVGNKFILPNTSNVDPIARIDGSAFSGFTSGSVLFVNSYGLIAEDNTKLFWDDGRNRLGIGETNPDQILHIKGTNAQVCIEESSTEFVRLGVEATSGDMCLGWDDSDDMHFGVFSTTTDTTITTRMIIKSGGSVDVVGNLSAGSFSSDSTISAGSGLTVGGIAKLSTFVQHGVNAQVIPDNFIPLANAAFNLMPAASYITLDCQDADGADVTMVEPAAVLNGMIFYILNISANVCNFADTAGLTELSGAFAMGQWDTLTLLYVNDRYVELSRSNN